jgi:hypothetical protein
MTVLADGNTTMSDKKIHRKYWSFNSIKKYPPVEVRRSFLWWSWTKTIVKQEYRYKTPQDILEDVNKFIQEEQIDNIIGLEDNAREIIDIEHGDCIHLGGIELTWFK